MAKQQIGNIDINRGAKGDMPSFTINSTTVTDGSVITVSGGESNTNVFIPTLATDFTSPDIENANKIWEIQTTIDLAGGSFTAPANITIFLNGGNVLNVGSFVGNKTSFKFVNETSVFDLFDATVTGTFIGETFLFSNLGGVDDNNVATDNKNTFEEALKLVNSVSGTLIVNKVDTGIYWMNPSDLEGPGSSPFFPNKITDLPYIGNGNDGVTMIIDGDVEIKQIGGSVDRCTLFEFYDTTNSKIIVNGTITGDRTIHDYFQEYSFTVAPTTGTFIKYRILIVNDKNYFDITQTIDENIPLTAGQTLAFVQNEILTYINTNPAFDGFTASSHPTIANRFIVRGPLGVFFKSFFDHDVAGTDTDLTYLQLNEITNTYENGWLITWGSRADYCEVLGSGTLQNATGEALFCGFQGNGQNWIQNFTRGDLDFDTGVFTASGTGKYMIMDEHRTVSTYVHPWFYVGYNSFGAVTSLYPTVWIMWEDASNNFLEMSPLQEMHRRIPVLDGAVKARLVLDYTPNSQYMFMDPKSMPLGGKVEGINFLYNRRQHIANPPPDLQIIGCTFDKVGGFWPQGDVDWEDHGKFSTDGLVQNNTFFNSNGGLIFKGTEGVKVVNNVWQAKTENIYSSGAITTEWGRKILISGNTFIRRSNSIDIGIIFTGNHMIDGTLTIGAGGSIVSDNVFVDVTIRDKVDSSAPATSGSGGATTSVIRNQTFLITKPWESKYPEYLREKGTIGYEDVTFKFNDRSQLHYSNNVTFPLVYHSMSSIGSNFNTRGTTTDQYSSKGFYKNVKVLDIIPFESSKHAAAWNFYAHYFVDGFECSTNVAINDGYIVDGIRWENIKAQGWLQLILKQYLATGIGTFPTVNLEKPFIQVPVETTSNSGYLNNTINGGGEWTTVFRTPLKDVNIVVKDGHFESLGNVTGYFLYAAQYGTLKFDTCKFISKAATLETINLTNTARVPATTGAITFIDPTFENVAVTLRSIDKIVFTKASPLMATYATFADDAAAATAGYPSGYMYMTATGEFRIKL